MYPSSEVRELRKKELLDCLKILERQRDLLKCELKKLYDELDIIKKMDEYDYKFKND